MAVVDPSKAHIPPKYNNRSFNLAGRTFNRLTVEGFAGRDCRGNYIWSCRCECGTETLVSAHYLKNGGIKSCGCLVNDVCGTATRTHGLSKTRLYGLWCNAVRRCTLPTHRDYENYGGRGIKMCDRWRQSFEAFLQDMGQRPSPRHELDRIDNDGDYEPGNVRWATRKEQCRNTRHNRFVEYNGERLTIAEWSERTGISARTIQKRLHRGCTMDRVFFLGRLHRSCYKLR